GPSTYTQLTRLISDAFLTGIRINDAHFTAGERATVAVLSYFIIGFGNRHHYGSAFGKAVMMRDGNGSETKIKNLVIPLRATRKTNLGNATDIGVGKVGMAGQRTKV